MEKLIRMFVWTGGPLLQRRLFKLNVTRPAVVVAAQAAKVSVTAAEARASTFTMVNLTSLLNGQLQYAAQRNTMHRTHTRALRLYLSTIVLRH